MLEKSDVIRFGLGALYHTRAHLALEPASCGLGLIFTLHRVYREQACEHPAYLRQAGFAPNRILQISDTFLDQTIVRVRERGLEIVTLDEARKRIIEGDDRRFAVFTIDDGYKDSRDIALPVFQRHECPFTVYVATGLIDRTVNLWWVALERLVAGAAHIEVDLGEGLQTFTCRTDDQKRAAFHAIYWPLRAMGEGQKLGTVAALAKAHNVDIAAIADELAMTGDELIDLASDPLVTIGAHTVDHPALARLEEGEMKREIAQGRKRLGDILGREPRHLAYPYGDPGSAGRREFDAAAELGFATAVTTRKGVVARAHADHLTALPRISLNGEYQDLRFVDVFLSGAPFALINGFRSLNVN